MTALRRPTRVLAVLALTAPLAGAILSTGISPARAAQSTSLSFDTVSDGDVVTSPKVVKATGTITNSGSTGSGASLVLTGPADAQGNTFSSTTGIDGCSAGGVGGGSCTSKATATVSTSRMTSRRNGHWTATVKGESGSVTKDFWTRLAPTSTPANLDATAKGYTEVDLSWSYSGTEIDRAGFQVTETSGSGTRRFDVPDSACSGSSCSLVIDDYSNSDPGTYEYSFTVIALRDSGNCPGCGATVASGPSNTATARLVVPQPPPPTEDPGGGGGSTSGDGGSTSGGSTSGGSSGGSTGKPGGGGASTTGGSTTGGGSGGSTTGKPSGGTTGKPSGGTSGTGTTGKPGGSKTTTKPSGSIPTLPPVVASRRAFALSFNKFSPSLGIPKLPPLPATTFPVTAPQTADETYQPTLPYQAVGGGTKTTTVFQRPVSVITTHLDTQQLAKFGAMGLLLLLAAAHLRLFLGSASEE